MNLVSVIMPYYKKKNYIIHSIRSVISQTYQRIEIIIIDDEISEESKKILNLISKVDKRIRIIRNTKNIGAGFSRNKGIQNSKGKYIAFCDCDDVWKKQKLETQIKIMEKNNYNFTFTSFEVIDCKDKIIGLRKSKKKISYTDLLKSCEIGLSTVIVKKTIFKNKFHLFPNIKTKEDYVCWLRISKADIEIVGINYSLSFWRDTKYSLSSSTIQKLVDGFRVYNKYLKFNIFKSLYFLIILSLNYLRK
jgi:teichuronic acid biosynthesis glycosyltransferase TuaG